MEYSISEAGKHTGRSADTVRRAIRAGKLKATKHPTAGYRITDTDLEAWAGRPPQAADLSADLEAARALIESQAADLETLRDQLTRERQVADAALESQRTATAALAAFMNRLESADREIASKVTTIEALTQGKTRRPWLRFRSTESRPPAER